MSQFLLLAESVFKNLKDRKEFTTDPHENLNKLIIQIRNELKDTKLKLIHNFIDFDECLTKANTSCKAHLDISLIPTVKNEGEFILWLASFIERLTSDGTKKIPPIRKDIPPDFKYSLPKAKRKNLSTSSDFSKTGELIKAYFKSDEFMSSLNKSH